MRDYGLLLLRVGFGATMLVAHGWPKLMNVSYLATKFPDPMGLGSQISLWLAIFAEVACSFLVVIGFKARWASMPLVITMLVAIFVVHAGDPWSKKEMAVLYLIPFFAIFLTGSGKYSVDSGR